MATDPLPLTDVLAGSSGEADYHATYAEVMASERGRWFLAQYAGRNRQADTQTLLGAISRVETAIRGDSGPQLSAALCRDLLGIAATIDRLEGEIATRRSPGADAAAAVERLQDIAFAMRERCVDAALCDALEAVTREITEAVGRGTRGGESALMHSLKVRVGALLAHATAAPNGQGGAAEPVTSAAADTGQEREDEEFAGTVGALAALFPAERSAPAAERQAEPIAALARPESEAGRAAAPRLPRVASVAAIADTYERIGSAAATAAPSPMAVSAEAQTDFEIFELVETAIRAAAQLADDLAAPTNGATAHEDLDDLFEPLPTAASLPVSTRAVESSDPQSAGGVAPPPREQRPRERPLRSAANEPAPERPASSNGRRPETAEEPPDLRPNRPVGAPPLRSALDGHSVAASRSQTPAAEPALPPPPAPAAAQDARLTPRASPAHPLASVRALSEQELIAIFS